MHLLHELWCGNVRPGELYSLPGSHYATLRKEAMSCLEQLYAGLTQKQKEQMEQFLEKFTQASSLSEEDSFIRGVRIGAGFVLDVSEDYQSQTPQKTGGQFYGSKR